MTETKIYVGLNDAVEKKQLMETEKYISVLRNVCYAYNTPFSFCVEEGGYIHENGEYTRETTLVLTLINTDKNIVNEIAKDLCMFFHQESVLITTGIVRTYYVSETLEEKE
ncbi:MAG: hypothetical protein IKF42_08040 [Mogibacterium sp.]|nr:hypothetical protein [Mogibacterium sp.]